MRDRVAAWIRDEIVDMRGEDYGDEVPHLVLVPVGSVPAGLEVGEPDEDSPEPTHLVRFVLRDPTVPLVDGDEWWLAVGHDGTIELCTVPDHPAFHGGELADAIAWCDELSR